MNLGRVIPTQKMEILHKGICEEMVLFTLSCDEVGKPIISSKLCELLTDPDSIHEGVMRPFARPHLRPSLSMEVIVRGFPNDSLIAFLGGKLPKETHLIPMNKVLKI